MLWTGQVNKDFSTKNFISKKMVTNMKLVHVQNSACVMIKKLLIFERVIIVRLVYISSLFPA